MSKYKDEAERNIDALHDWQSMEGTTDATLITVAIEAQASATLYLAEQQRIANLIALSQVPQGWNSISAKDGAVTPADYFRVYESMREGLGIA